MNHLRTGDFSLVTEKWFKTLFLDILHSSHDISL